MSKDSFQTITKTNFFRVKDEAAFRDFMDRVLVYNGKITVYDQMDHKGRNQFAFCTKGELAGFTHTTTDGKVKSVYDVDALCDELMTHVCDYDAMIIFQFGNDDNGSFAGCAKILTSTGISSLDLRGMAIEKAAEMLELPEWTTTLLD